MSERLAYRLAVAATYAVYATLACTSSYVAQAIFNDDPSAWPVASAWGLAFALVAGVVHPVAKANWERAWERAQVVRRAETNARMTAYLQSRGW